jgi:hypothetical protein
MARKPVAWMKIYTPSGAYVASCNDFAAAAALMAFYGAGAEIRNGHSATNALWREGHESFSAATHPGQVEHTVRERVAPSATDPVGERHRRAQEDLESTRSLVRSMIARGPR